MTESAGESSEPFSAAAGATPLSELTVPPESVATVRTRPDVSEVQPDGWPVRSTATATGQRQAKYQAVIRQSVLDAIHGHGKSSTSVEVCGVLVGSVYQDDFGPYLHVNSSIRGDRAKGHAAQVTFTAETWSAIQAAMDQDHPDERIVGWYHTHPGFGIFLSGMDLFIQDHFFNLPWQVAFVYDPLGGDEGLFYWKDGKADRQPFLIEPDQSLITSDRSNKQTAPSLAEVEAAELETATSPSAAPAAFQASMFSPPPPPQASQASDRSGAKNVGPRHSTLSMWLLGAVAFAVSFAGTLWGMYSIRHEEIIIPHHVDHSATQPKDRH